jgi:hypothetical protein
MVVVEGKHGIKATVLKDSICHSNARLTTFEIEYPRIVLSELNTHRALSRSSSSSRAIPFDKMVQQLTGRPVRFGQANPGMQDRGEDYNGTIYLDTVEVTGRGEDEVWTPVYAGPMTAEDAWYQARVGASDIARAFKEAGYHKQVYNRLLEPFQMMKTIISATEWENFFWLRDHEAADPSLAELARVIREARDKSIPAFLGPGEWHLPYVETERDELDEVLYYIHDDTGLCYLNKEEAIKVSAARCAAVSFRNVDYGLEKCQQVYERLVGDDRKHASALEHQATPMKKTDRAYNSLWPATWEEGVSHIGKDYTLWSGNFRGWIQHRKLIPGENKAG